MRARRAHHSAAAAAGFTLLELVMVMLILCIVALMAVPAFRFFAEGHQVDDCAAQIVSLAQWARTQAISRGVTYRLNLDPSARTYGLSVDQGDGTFAPVPEEFGRIFTLPDGVS